MNSLREDAATCFDAARRSMDRAHFAQARQPQPEPEDQAVIPHPRVGYYGDLDDRFDLDLLNRVARLLPEVQFVVLAPARQQAGAGQPYRENIHFLGSKAYSRLPHYVAQWNVAMLPLALNEATRYTHPTTILEYLAAGKPVVATPIQYVVHPYGERGLVEIALTAVAFAEAIRRLLANPNDAEWRQNIETCLNAPIMTGATAGMRTRLDRATHH